MTLADFIAAIRTHDAQATKGPWSVDHHYCCALDGKGEPIADHWEGAMCETDAEFIAFARTALPLAGELIEYLLNECEELSIGQDWSTVQRRVQQILDAARQEGQE